jgi:hypothetical protein
MACGAKQPAKCLSVASESSFHSPKCVNTPLTLKKDERILLGGGLKNSGGIFSRIKVTGA